jgi:hypothetical protein
MSEEKRVIEITPPPYLEQGREIESQTMKDFRCPRCFGHGHFMPKETGKDKYEEVKCCVCQGTGCLEADVVIRWVPSRDNRKDHD